MMRQELRGPIWITAPGQPGQFFDTRVVFSLAILVIPERGEVSITALDSNNRQLGDGEIPEVFLSTVNQAVQQYRGEMLDIVTLTRMTKTIDSIAFHMCLLTFKGAFVVERGSALYETLLPTFS